MSNKLSTYSFIPWLRLGIANQVQTEDYDESIKLRAPIDVNLNIHGEGLDPESINKSVSLYGPGDIIGIDSKAIIGTDPGNWITNFEPNYLASIDFYEEDFPWRYTPAKPDQDNNRLRPWLTLLILKEKIEFCDGKNMTGRPLPYIEINPDAVSIFPPADQLWAWAHVHVNRDLVENELLFESETGQPYIENVNTGANEDIIEEFKKTIRENPDMAYSRILCPRRLEENTAYHAFLVPTFESGRLAGLGKDVESIFNTEDSPLYATRSAWDLDGYPDREDPQLYPYYHRWYFRTGSVGDFEYLVRLLEPKPVDNRVGRRDMDIREPGANIDGITDDPDNGAEVPHLDGILRLGGALRIPVETLKEEDREEYEKYENWAKPYPRDFQKQLAAFINLADDYSNLTAGDAHLNPDLPDNIINKSAVQEEPDPFITAPLYGRWHTLTKRLLTTGDDIPDDNWIHELNLDPRFRVAAGFGTVVVQTNQEKYMESAWQQAGAVIEANQRIRQAQLAQSAANFWYTEYLQTLYQKNNGAFLWLTQPVQARVLANGFNVNGEEVTATIHHHVKTSKVPSVAFSPNIRKLVRPNGRLHKGLHFDPDSNPVTSLINRINKDEIKSAPDKTVPAGIITIKDLVRNSKSGIPGFILKWIVKLPWMKFLLLGIAAIILVLLAIFVCPDLNSITPGTGSVSGFAMLIAFLLIYLVIRLFQWGKQIELTDTLKDENQTPEAVEELPENPDFQLTIPGQGIYFDKGRNDSEESKRFKQALEDVGELMQANSVVAIEPEQPALDLNELATATFQTLNPEVTITRSTYGTVIIPDRIKFGTVKEVFKEAMVYPEFDVPMYKPLIEKSSELFLPNINFIDQNSISFLETNQKFIEAYMVGLNHEFARELLWREYPTDQRGSYFRQFWDTSDYLFDPDQLEAFINQIKQEHETEDEEIIDQKLREMIREKLRDIPPIDKWSKFSSLGDHDHREQPGDNEQEAVLVIRGELLKKYPNAVIYAHRAKWKPKEGTENEADKGQERELIPIPPELEDNPPRDTLKTPLYEAKVEPDIYFFGFDITVEEAQGLTEGEPYNLEDRAGWFFILKERPGEPRFGLDIGSTELEEVEVWNDLAWGNITPEVPGGSFIRLTSDSEVTLASLESDDDEKRSQRMEDEKIFLNEQMNSAELAYILFQAPVMVAVHGAEMLPRT